MNPSVQLTDAAVQRIAELLQTRAQTGAPCRLRLALSSGGCQGFQYQFQMDDQLNDDDVIFEKDGVSAVIDQTSLTLLQDAIIDYKKSMIGAAFTVENPNAATACGCGQSFSI